jgi:hypothetical protein
MRSFCRCFSSSTRPCSRERRSSSRAMHNLERERERQYYIKLSASSRFSQPLYKYVLIRVYPAFTGDRLSSSHLLCFLMIWKARLTLPCVLSCLVVVLGCRRSMRRWTNSSPRSRTRSSSRYILLLLLLII